MYCLSDEQIDYILDDIRRNGVEMEDLQYNLLDHVCCILEQTLTVDTDFERTYSATIRQFYKHRLSEIEEETIQLLTFKNYYAMKKVMMISGAASVVCFIGGSLLKIGHLQGAATLIVLGMLLLSFLFLPMLAIMKMRELASMRDKLVTLLGTLVGILYALSVMFAIFRWQGNTFMWLATVSISMFVLIPVYFFTGIRQPEIRTNTIVTSVLMVGATCLLFSMIALKPATNTQANTATTPAQQVAKK